MTDTTRKRAKNNRTLELNADEAEKLKKRLLTEKALGAAPLSSEALMNKTLIADTLRVLPRVPDAFADLIIVDPPYNLTKNFHGLQFNARSADSYEAYLASWVPELCKKLKPHGSLYMCGDWKCSASLQKALANELTVINRITWQREKGRGATANWKNAMEDIWFAVKDAQHYYFNADAVKIKRKVLAPYTSAGKPKDWEKTENGNFRLTYPSNFWDDITVPFWSMPENTDHPTQKPEKLYAKLILASSKEGDVVFDPFLGSGTASVTAKKLKRNYFGIEINETYCLWAEKRLQNADTDTAIQGFSDGVFWERNSHEARKK